ncbi:MAG: hypothetical protein ACRD2L_03330 [Terriglobia bacterium]
MQSRSFAVLVLILWAATGTPLRADSSEYRVKHDHVLGSCQGKLIVSDQEIRYEPSDEKHAQSWPYMDIQKLDVVSPTQLTLKTFKSANWKKLGKDETFKFSLIEGQLTAANQEFLRSKLSRPMVARLTEPKEITSAAFPVRHRHRLGGCEGHLQVEEDRLVYFTDRLNDNRVWKLSEIESIGSFDPYRFRVTTYNETFTFDLKAPLDLKIYDSLWKKIYRLEPAISQRAITRDELHKHS